MPPTYTADLHTHSSYAYATSPALDFPNIAHWARHQGHRPARLRRLHPSRLVRPHPRHPNRSWQRTVRVRRRQLHPRNRSQLRRPRRRQEPSRPPPRLRARLRGGGERQRPARRHRRQARWRRQAHAHHRPPRLHRHHARRRPALLHHPRPRLDPLVRTVRLQVRLRLARRVLRRHDAPHPRRRDRTVQRPRHVLARSRPRPYVHRLILRRPLTAQAGARAHRLPGRAELRRPRRRARVAGHRLHPRILPRRGQVP